jgi:hypothetical protein
MIISPTILTGWSLLWRRNWFPVRDGLNLYILFTSARNQQGSGPPGWGSLECETVKYGHESRETRTREWLRWRVPSAIINDRPFLSSARALHIKKPATVWLIRMWSWARDGRLTPRQTGRLTVGRNVTLYLWLQKVKCLNWPALCSRKTKD